MPTTGIVKGGAIRLSVDGTTVAKTTSGDISFTTATEAIQHDDNVTAGGISWDKADAVSNSVTVNAEAFYAESEQFETFWAGVTGGTKLSNVKVSTGVTGDLEFTGTFVVTSLNLTYSTTDRAKFSLSLQSDGEVTRAAAS
jgi:hypothetical protein